MVEESPVFDGLEERYGQGFSAFLAGKIEVVEGDVSQPAWDSSRSCASN